MALCGGGKGEFRCSSLLSVSALCDVPSSSGSWNAVSWLWCRICRVGLTSWDTCWPSLGAARECYLTSPCRISRFSIWESPVLHTGCWTKTDSYVLCQSAFAFLQNCVGPLGRLWYGWWLQDPSFSTIFTKLCEYTWYLSWVLDQHTNTSPASLAVWSL